MPDRLDSSTITRLRELLEAATEGPWQHASPHHIVRTERWRGPNVAEPMAVGNKSNDAAFIAEARNYFAALLDAAEAVQELRKIHQWVACECDSHSPERAKECAECGYHWPCDTIKALGGPHAG